MKRVILLAAVALAFIGTTNAQGRGNWGDRMEHFKQMRKQQLKDSLQFSDDKADKVIAIEAEFQPKMREIMQDESSEKDAKKAKLKDLREEQKKKLQTVLTDDELAKLEAFQERNRGRMRAGGGRPGGRMGGHDAPPPPSSPGT